MQLFYNPEITEESSQIVFSKEESNHIVKVLRKQVGDKLQITNGKGWLFNAEISIPNIKKCIATIVSKEKQQQRLIKLHVAVAPTKMNDSYEWFLEKATEIGIETITPIICDHSERKIIKPERFEKIIQSAMKQSLNCYFPKLNDPIPFKEFIKQDFRGQRFIAHCEDEEKLELKRRVAADKDVTILIGPEGDFTQSEIKMAYDKGYLPVSLGKNRLRTETAGIVACTTVAMINNG